MSPYWSLKLELDLELDQGTSIQFHSQGMSVQDMELEPYLSLKLRHQHLKWIKLEKEKLENHLEFGTR